MMTIVWPPAIALSPAALAWSARLAPRRGIADSVNGPRIDTDDRKRRAPLQSTLSEFTDQSGAFQQANAPCRPSLATLEGKPGVPLFEPGFRQGFSEKKPSTAAAQWMLGLWWHGLKGLAMVHFEAVGSAVLISGISSTPRILGGPARGDFLMTSTERRGVLSSVLGVCGSVHTELGKSGNSATETLAVTFCGSKLERTVRPRAGSGENASTASSATGVISATRNLLLLVRGPGFCETGARRVAGHICATFRQRDSASLSHTS